MAYLQPPSVGGFGDGFEEPNSTRICPFCWLVHATQAIFTAEWSSTGIIPGYIIWCKDISNMPKHMLQLEAYHSSFQAQQSKPIAKYSISYIWEIISMSEFS